MSGQEPIAVTGLGVVSPIGLGVKAFWKAALAGQDGVKEIRSFDTAGLTSTRAGEIEGFDPAMFVGTEEAARMGRCTHLTVAAARMAWEEAGLVGVSPWRVGVSLGNNMGDPEAFHEMGAAQGQRGMAGFERRFPSFRVSEAVALELGLQGPLLQIPTSCSAGNYGIGYGLELLRARRADAVVAGGSDALNRTAYAGFNRLRAHAPDRCRPFDLNRKGMILSEGAGALVLERLSDARARGAEIKALIISWGLGCDAYNMTIPEPAGRGGIRAIRQALSRGGLRPEDVDYISAHGTGTRENDRVETLIIKECLGDHARKVPISSMKSMIGHTMGGSSAIEAVVCCLSVLEDRIHPTINYETPDPTCDLDYVPNQARDHRVRLALSNSYAFGGNSSCLVVAKADWAG